MSKLESLKMDDIFCIAPFVNFSTTTNGHARLCCQAKEWTDINLLELDVEKVWNHENFKKARDSFRNNQWPESCSICKNLESKNIKSRRELENKRWDHLNWEELKNNPKIHCFDLRLGNQCNLKCVMCTPRNSTTWYDDYQQIDHLRGWKPRPELQWAIKGNILNDIENYLDDIQMLYFSGGEPLLNKKHNSILNLLIEKKLSDKIKLVYDTNGTQITKNHIDMWNKFKNVQINFSIDGTYEIDEYIRYPIKYSDVIKKFELLSKSNTDVYLQFALGAHNILNIKNIFDLQKKYSFKDINISIVHWPEFMQIKHLSNNIKFKCKKELGDIDHKRLQDMLSALEFDNSKPLELQKYFSQLDKIRNTDHKKIFTWIYE